MCRHRCYNYFDKYKFANKKVRSLPMQSHAPKNAVTLFQKGCYTLFTNIQLNLLQGNIETRVYAFYNISVPPVKDFIKLLKSKKL